MHAGLLQSVVLLRLPRMQLHSLGLVASYGPCVEVRASFSGSFSYLLQCGFPNIKLNSIWLASRTFTC